MSAPLQHKNKPKIFTFLTGVITKDFTQKNDITITSSFRALPYLMRYTLMAFWKNMSLNKKFIVFALLLLLNIVFMGYMFLNTLDGSEKGFKEVEDIESLSARMSARETDHIVWVSNLQRVLLNEFDMKNLSDERQCAFGRWYYGQERKDAEKEFPDLTKPLADIEAFHTALHASAKAIGAALSKGDRESALALYAKESSPRLQDVRGQFQLMLKMLDENKVEQHAKFGALIENAKTGSLVMVVVAFVVAGLLTFLIARSTSRPVIRIAEYARKVAAGDLNATITVDSKDEIGQLGEALQSIPRVLTTIVEEYQMLASRVQHGDIRAVGDPSQFSGSYASLVVGTNAIIDVFQTIVESLPSPIFAMDDKLNVIYANAVAQKMIGREYKGLPCNELYTMSDYGTSNCALNRALTTALPASATVSAVMQGKKHEIDYTAIPIIDAQSQVVAILQLITDLTEIKETQARIMDVASRAHGIANDVGAASGELTTRINEVSNGAMIQKDRVASTATAMEEMNSTVLEVARNAGLARERAETTRQKADEGAELVGQLISAVERVRQLTQVMEQSMMTLGTQAESIGTVMNVISDIADQTNLLALNAAIEAARAGEAGRGFAVVADEVRKLAENTMSATVEVGDSIKGIQRSTESSIEQVAGATRSVDDAANVAVVSGEALRDILNLADETASLIMGIATAAEQQSATSDEINLSVEDIHKIADSTALDMQDSAQATASLAQMVEDLRLLLEELR